MALRIIGAGFGRTGTLSVYTALKQLGFPCYHMFEVLENKENKSHLAFWHKVANAEPGARHDWEQVFSKYTAAVDNPSCCVWRELLVAYPDAKVVLTLHPRGAEAWYESTMDTIYFTETMWQFKVLEFATPFGRKFGDMTRKLIWHRSHKGTMSDRDKAIAHYHQHIADIKAAVPEDRLLVFSADQGWKPLCEFLGVPVPESEFPNVNDRAAIKKTVNDLTKGAYAILGDYILDVPERAFIMPDDRPVLVITPELQAWVSQFLWHWEDSCMLANDAAKVICENILASLQADAQGLQHDLPDPEVLMREPETV